MSNFRILAAILASVFLTSCSDPSIDSIDFQKVYFQTLEIEKQPIVDAVYYVNKTHHNQNADNPEFKILIEDPINMDAQVSLKLTNATLSSALDLMLSDTGYYYIVQGNFIIILNQDNLFQAKNVLEDSDETSIRNSVCSIEVNPSYNEVIPYEAQFSASGFLCKINENKFLVTNIHVIANANSLEDITVKTRDNIEIKLTDCFVAQDRDLCVFMHEDDPKLTHLDISTAVSRKQSKKPIYVLGYPLGGGTMVETEGTLKGVGNSLIEIDCAAFKGNGGGPVLDAITNEVIGVLTKVENVPEDPFTKLVSKKLGNPFKSGLRIHATRLDTVDTSSWEKLVWRDWKEEKNRRWRHYNTIAAVSEIVSRKRIVANEKTQLDPDVWRMSKNHLITSRPRGADKYRINYLRESFVRGMEGLIRPISGSKWLEISKPWRYRWFASSDSGNVYGVTVEEIKQYYRILHNNWQTVVKQWELDVTIPRDG
jgi:S1-C subfamily serine protease